MLAYSKASIEKVIIPRLYAALIGADRLSDDACLLVFGISPGYTEVPRCPFDEFKFRKRSKCAGCCNEEEYTAAS